MNQSLKMAFWLVLATAAPFVFVLALLLTPAGIEWIGVTAGFVGFCFVGAIISAPDFSNNLSNDKIKIRELQKKIKSLKAESLLAKADYDCETTNLKQEIEHWKSTYDDYVTSFTRKRPRPADVTTSRQEHYENVIRERDYIKEQYAETVRMYQESSRKHHEIKLKLDSYAKEQGDVYHWKKKYYDLEFIYLQVEGELRRLKENITNVKGWTHEYDMQREIHARAEEIEKQMQLVKQGRPGMTEEGERKLKQAIVDGELKVFEGVPSPYWADRQIWFKLDDRWIEEYL